MNWRITINISLLWVSVRASFPCTHYVWQPWNPSYVWGEIVNHLCMLNSINGAYKGGPHLPAHTHSAGQWRIYGGQHPISRDPTYPGPCLAQFSLNSVHKRGLKHHHFISFPPALFITWCNITFVITFVFCYYLWTTLQHFNIYHWVYIPCMIIHWDTMA